MDFCTLDYGETCVQRVPHEARGNFGPFLLVGGYRERLRLEFFLDDVLEF